MSDLPSKLDALGDLLDVQDDTRELDRPAPRRPVGEILRGEPDSRGFRCGRRRRVPTASRARPSGPRAARAGVHTGSNRDPTAPPRTTPTAQPTWTDRRDPRRRAAGQRTSANLPVGLVERLLGAKQRRWELSQLVASALVNVDLDPGQADDLLDRVVARHPRAARLPASCRRHRPPRRARRTVADEPLPGDRRHRPGRDGPSRPVARRPQPPVDTLVPGRPGLRLCATARLRQVRRLAALRASTVTLLASRGRGAAKTDRWGSAARAQPLSSPASALAPMSEGPGRGAARGSRGQAARPANAKVSGNADVTTSGHCDSARRPRAAPSVPPSAARNNC